MGGAGGSRAGTTKVGVGGTPHPVGACWGVLLARHGDPWVDLHGLGHAEEEGGWPTEGPVKMGEGGGGERDAEEK